MKELTQAQIDLLNEPLPAEAIKQHPTKKFMSTIKSIYVTERFNNVFGIGKWTIKSEVVESNEKMIVVKTLFAVPDYGISYECYGGNDNADRGDAYKGAVTDAITKVGSWMGVGANIWKDEKVVLQTPPQAAPAKRIEPKPETEGQKMTDQNRNNLTEIVEKSKAEDELKRAYLKKISEFEYYADAQKWLNNIKHTL